MDPRTVPPLNALPEAEREALLREAREETHPAGTRFLEQGGRPAQALFLLLEGEVALLEGEAEVGTLGPGEFFGFPSLLSGEPPALSVVARTPVRLCVFPEEAFRRLMAFAEAARFFGQGLVERIRLRAAPDVSLFAPVGRLVRRPPVFVPPSATVAEAARLMRQEGISSLLVQGEPLGILTDRDLRNRVLAQDLPPTTPVGAVMSAPLFALSATTPLYEAVAAMVERGIHHLPLTEGEKVVGVVTHTDLLLHQAQSPLLLLRRIERLELERYSAEVAGLVEGLFQRGLGGVEIGRVVASLNDALIRRLVKEAEAALGNPPVPYSFMVFGSEGRREQALLTDQDNALVLGEGGHETYFQALAERVVVGLLQAGIPECRGGYMATRWRLPLGEWMATFRRWMEAPEPQALLETQIFFDLRSAAGTLSLAPLEEVVLEGSRKGLFLYHLARASLEFRPPLGLFGRVRTEEGMLDLKRHALAPIVALARLYALMAGSLAKGTVERLRAAAAGGTLSQEGAERLEEAYRFFFGLRLGHQLRAWREGKPIGNKVAWALLSPGERRRALEGFRAIQEVQESTASRFQLR
ncbi:Cyclic nucleotide binding protein/2 cbs domains [Thermus sp. CCB_US3_UF1]|uniref:putative nucleotidyltransferase substrate binding domain-containing protein n=1 Tax=Thermus sp. CCB_US3_UF1 TaxID=1111069 RepID=UPI00023898AD|nr:putative nucleotidyltransferase substrate binding domain-containing protein [Thermus sp. CCB_US3_UF1]AEV15880.1 Cyclic nucleotide binding protein/2 cbs domains [Thermus sp. CCB_US3_UF1]